MLLCPRCDYGRMDSRPALVELFDCKLRVATDEGHDLDRVRVRHDAFRVKVRSNEFGL
jgi:hypothetical protein